MYCLHCDSWDHIVQYCPWLMDVYGKVRYISKYHCSVKEKKRCSICFKIGNFHHNKCKRHKAN